MEPKMVKKWNVALFLKDESSVTEKWIRIKKSTAFDLSMNPETQDFDYISDESPTKELMKYAPTLNQSLTMYKGEPDYELVFDKFFNLKVGSDAKSKVLIAFFQEPLDKDAEPHKVFKAWKSDCVISVNNLNSVDSTITFDVLFGGTVQTGYVSVTDGEPVFTSGEYTTE